MHVYELGYTQCILTEICHNGIQITKELHILVSNHLSNCLFQLHFRLPVNVKHSQNQCLNCSVFYTEITPRLVKYQLSQLMQYNIYKCNCSIWVFCLKRIIAPFCVKCKRKGDYTKYSYYQNTPVTLIHLSFRQCTVSRNVYKFPTTISWLDNSWVPYH